MSKKILIPLGILFFFVGVVLIFNSISGITGLAVLENVAAFQGSIAGIILIILAILAFALSLKKSEKKHPLSSIIEDD